jgi:hypothetical protein
MTKDGVLYVQEQLANKLEDEITEALAEHEIHEPFRLNPQLGGGWHQNIEKRWPNESDIPVYCYQERVGTLHVEMESTVKQGMTGAEYVGKKLTDYTITITQ